MNPFSPNYKPQLSALTQSELKKYLHYSVITGELYRIKTVANNARAGFKAGSFDTRGYMQITVNGRKYKSHRLIWFYVTGEWPNGEIDHKNGIRHANAWLNLREANHSQNQRNKGLQKNNTSGYKGVVWDAACKKWRASIGANKKTTYLGLYKTPELAYEAYSKAAKDLYSDFYKNQTQL